MKNLRNRNQPVNADLVQVYLESAWDKVEAIYAQLDNIEDVADAINAGDLDDFLAAGDIDTLAKLNAIVTDATLGDAGDFATAAQGALADNSMQLPIASQAEAEAGTDNNRPMTPLRVAQAIAALSGVVKNSYNETGDPQVTDDVNAGYSVGSVWINTTSDETFRCVDNTAGAAVWVKTTLSADELATVAFTGSSDDLVEGVAKLLMTVAERNKLAGIEAGATGDLSGAEIKALYEAEADTNAFTDALLTKLSGIETAATADQTQAEIAALYQAEVPLVSQAVAEAGTDTAIRSWSALRVAQAIAALGGGGAGGLAAKYIDNTYTATAADWIMADSLTNGSWQLDLPASPGLNDLVVIMDCTGGCGQNPITIDGDGTDTINGNYTFELNHPYAAVFLIWNGTEWKTGVTGMFIQGPTEFMSFALSDETSDLVVGTTVVTARTPYKFFVTGVKASVSTAPTGAAIQVDINEDGISILDNPLTIDAGDKTSVGSAAASPYGLSVVQLSADSELTFDIDQIGSTVAGAGLKVTIEGYRVQ